MEPSLTGIVEILQGGGNLALVAAVWFIYKATHRLARVEVLLETLVKRLDPKAPIPPEINGG